MRYVTLLRSLSHPDQRYVGFTADLKDRFKAHNDGRSIHTAKYMPWDLVAAFKNERRARIRALSEIRFRQSLRD